jgi:hypothetical protein
MLSKVKWATCRLLFYIAVMLSLLTGGLLCYLLAPLFSYCFLNNLHFIRNHKYIFPLIKTGWNWVFTWISSREYRQVFSVPLTAPPLTTPDLTYVKVSEQWNEGTFDCNQCIRCCIKIDCPLIDRESNGCLSYNSFYWRYFACGRYPRTQYQIDYYNCPKWEAI